MSNSSKVVVITGASSGIGAETARRLAADGHRVVLGARRKEKLDQLVADLGADRAIAQMCDVTDKTAVQSLVDRAVEQFGSLDVMINNAGLMPLSFLAHGKTDDWEQMVDVNIKGVLWGIAAALPRFLEQGSGQMINIASVAGISVFPSGAVYCATKHAVRALSEGLRQESRGKFRVTVISPGAIETELTETITDPKIAAGIEKTYSVALDAAVIADTIAYAIDHPDHVGINEIVVRPTAQQ